MMTASTKKRKVQILRKETIFRKSIFKVEQVHLKHERFDGRMSQKITRLNLERGDGVAAVLHNQQDDTLVMIEQFRYATYDRGNEGWMIELPAGIVEDDEDDDPKETMHRELAEEIGYQVESLRPIGKFYLSPGGSTEQIYLYYANVTPDNKTEDGGGLDEEDEDIRTLIIPVQDALHKVSTGEICDAKTIIDLQWLQINRRQ